MLRGSSAIATPKRSYATWRARQDSHNRQQLATGDARAGTRRKSTSTCSGVEPPSGVTGRLGIVEHETFQIAMPYHTRQL